MNTIRYLSLVTLSTIFLLQHQSRAPNPLPASIPLSKFAARAAARQLSKGQYHDSKGTMESPTMNITSDFELRAKAPNKQWSKVEFPGLGAMIEGCDGKVAWATNSFQGLREKPATNLQKLSGILIYNALST
jgi:hypothetical protein